MNRIFQRANQRISLGSAAFLLSGSSFVGILLGVVRTKLINANFNGFSQSAYFAAFKLPDLVFFTLATGALGVAFMPVLSDKFNKQSRQAAWELTSSIMNLLAMMTLVFSVLIIIFAKPIIDHIIAPGFPEEQAQVAAAIMRLVAVNPFLFSISTVLTSAQQTAGRFFFYAVAPLFYNLAIILSIYIFGGSLGVVGVGLGVAIGAVLQLIVASMGMIGMRFSYQFKINFKEPGFRQVMKALPARSVDQGIDYINGIVETRLASRISIVALGNYENALLLHNAPIMLIGTAISTAAFPRFTERIAQGRPDLFRKEFRMVLRAMIWIAMPVVVTSYFTRDYLARLIYARDNREIALIFGALIVAIFFRTMYTIISRYFYAQKDTRTPLYVSLFSIGLNIFLAYKLSAASSYGVVGLALAQSIVALTEVIILLTIMIIRDRRIFTAQFLNGIVRILSVTGFTVLVAYLAVILLPFHGTDRGMTIVAKLSVISAVVIITHVGLSQAMQLEESAPVMERIKKIILRPIKI